MTSKARTGARAKKRPSKAPPKKPSKKVGLLKSATRKVATAVARLRAPAKPVPARPAPPVPVVRLPERQRPRATKLPPVGEALTRREMEQIIREEQQRIFATQWMNVGRADSIAAPGSFFLTDVAGESIITYRRLYRSRALMQIGDQCIQRHAKSLSGNY